LISPVSKYCPYLESTNRKDVRAGSSHYQSDDAAPAGALIGKNSHTINTCYTILAQIGGPSYQQAAAPDDHNPKTFLRYMKRAVQMLSAAYA
jgi:hypothetical protein